MPDLPGARIADQVGDALGRVKDTVADAAPLARDPVCGKPVPRAPGATTYTYADVTHVFCSQACMERFAEQPEVFLSHPGQEGDRADSDRAQRPDSYRPGELEPGTPARLEQPQVESGGG